MSEVAALTIWKEARGEPFRDKLGIAYVILNRAAHPRWWGGSVLEVCMKPSQFSCWNDNDPNYLLKPDDRDASWHDARYAWELARTGGLPDPTHGADHYHTISVQPGWSLGKTPTYIGRRTKFFKLELG